MARIAKKTVVLVKVEVTSGTDYRIVAHEPDGTGMSRLILELA